MSDKHKYFFGYLNILKDYGKTIIRPETFVDKISELFYPVEIDFTEYKRFSRNYYFLSNDREKTINNMDENLIIFMNSVLNIHLEFNGKKCIYRLPKSINLKEANNLCEIGFQLDKILNLKASNLG